MASTANQYAMPPNRYHSNQRCADKASASTKPISSPVPNMAPAPHVSLAKVENMVNNIVHLALHKVNSNKAIMEVYSTKLKPLKATLRQQLTFGFLKVFSELNGKSCSRKYKKSAHIKALF